MKARVTARLNKRLWPNTANTPLPNPLQPNDIIDIVEEVDGTAPLHSTNTKWYKTADKYYVWSGGVEVKSPAIVDLREESQSAVQSSNFWIRRFGIDKIWSETTGVGINVGIIDSGIDASHPDLISSVGATRNFFKKDDPVDDFDGHGTHCAGILAGRGTQRIYGVAPGVTLNVAKIFGMTGFGVNEQLLFKALEWTIGNSEIISLSAGIPDHSQQIADLVGKAVNEGKIIVCAIGNLSEEDPRSDGDFPATDPNVISVGSFNESFTLSSETKRFKNLTICAPGENIVSTFTTKITPYKSMSGTSMATPFIAGLLALKKSKDPGFNFSKAQDFLRQLSETKTDGSFRYSVLSSNPITL